MPLDLAIPAKPIPRLTPKEADRFWSRVKAGAAGECWEWQGECSRRGYGRVVLRGIRYRAHRVAYTAHHGTSPPRGLRVCHTCDNGICVNPAHLVLRTQLWNIQDRQRKGRHMRGERAGNAKFTDAEVATIKRRLQSGEDWRGVAASVGARPAHIYQIGTGRIWTHIEPKGCVIPRVYHKLSDGEKQEIREAFEAGEKPLDIAERLGLSRRAVYRTLWNDWRQQMRLDLLGR